MAIDRKYGKLDVPGIGEDEPIFILRAQDILSPDTIQDYADRSADADSPPHHVTGVLASKQDFLDWQATHHTQVPQSARQAPTG